MVVFHITTSHSKTLYYITKISYNVQFIFQGSILCDKMLFTKWLFTSVYL